MTISIEGFYTAYITGAAGNGLGLVTFQSGVIAGVDAAGALFDGQYTVSSDEKISATISVKIPANAQLVQGGSSGVAGANYETNFELTAQTIGDPFFRVNTPFGPVNVKLVKIRDFISKAA